MDIRSGLVQRCVDHETRSVDLVAGLGESFSMLVHENQVTGFDQTEMDRVGVYLFGIYE